MANPFEGERPVWVNYIRVEDPAAITARVEGLGGNILVEAQERDIGGKVAFIAGPSGAGIVLRQELQPLRPSIFMDGLVDMMPAGRRKNSFTQIRLGLLC